MGQALAHLSYVSSMHCDLSVIVAEGSTASCRNRLVLGAMEAEASHILFVDADNVFPPNGLVRLLQRDKDIVGATYSRRAPPYIVLGGWEQPIDGLAKAKSMPAGFLLIKTEVFGKIEPPWFADTFDWSRRSPENVVGLVSDDVYFGHKAEAAGISSYVDLDVTAEMGHIGEIIATCTKN